MLELKPEINKSIILLSAQAKFNFYRVYSIYSNKSNLADYQWLCHYLRFLGDGFIGYIQEYIFPNCAGFLFIVNDCKDAGCRATQEQLPRRKEGRIASYESNFTTLKMNKKISKSDIFIVGNRLNIRACSNPLVQLLMRQYHGWS